MEYLCSVCQRMVKGDLIFFKDHTENHIIELVKHDHPQWVEKNGMCVQCLEYYRSELKGSAFHDAPCVLRQRKIAAFFASLKNFFKGGAK